MRIMEFLIKTSKTTIRNKIMKLIECIYSCNKNDTHTMINLNDVLRDSYYPFSMINKVCFLLSSATGTCRNILFRSNIENILVPVNVSKQSKH